MMELLCFIRIFGIKIATDFCRSSVQNSVMVGHKPEPCTAHRIIVAKSLMTNIVSIYQKIA